MALTRLGTNAITTVPNSAITLDAAEIPNLDTAKITTGTLANARISAGSVTQHVTATDLQPIKSDISALALREATNESSAAFNLPNQFIDTFTDDTNLGTQTDGDRVDGCWTTISVAVGSYETGNQTSTYTLTSTAPSTTGTLANWLDGDTSSNAWYINSNGSVTADSHYMRFDLGSGNSKVFTGAKTYATNQVTRGVWKWQGSDNASSWTDLSSSFTWNHPTGSGSPYTQENLWTPAAGYRYIQMTGVSGNHSDNGWQFECQFRVGSISASATGTLIQSANTVASAKTKVGGTMLYKDNAGTATIGTDLKIYFTCNGGSNWTEASSYSAITPVYSTGIKQVRLGETTCTSGTDVRYKAVWANQAASSKETQLHGIGVNY